MIWLQPNLVSGPSLCLGGSSISLGNHIIIVLLFIPEGRRYSISYQFVDWIGQDAWLNRDHVRKWPLCLFLKLGLHSSLRTHRSTEKGKLWFMNHKSFILILLSVLTLEPWYLGWHRLPLPWLRGPGEMVDDLASALPLDRLHPLYPCHLHFCSYKDMSLSRCQGLPRLSPIPLPVLSGVTHIARPLPPATCTCFWVLFC